MDSSGSLHETFGSKFVNIAGQIRSPGTSSPPISAVGLAYTVVGFAGLVQQGGYKEILIQRQKHFNRWANAAFWMSVAFALLAACIMLIAAPVAARVYRTPRPDIDAGDPRYRSPD